ncbi:transposase [Rathayibacter rathayi]|uniref:transposase n=1 Tax=Rathayibacter rathayi TaxID=33887 RepID=UPI0030B99CF7
MHARGQRRESARRRGREEAVREVIDRSRSVADVAREFGLVPQTLTSWVAAHRRTSAGGEEELTVQDRARIKELERRVRELEEGNLFLGKASAFFAKKFR